MLLSLMSYMRSILKLPDDINDFNAIIYIDNIMKASDNTLLNPGLIGILVRDAIECARDNWKVVLTQSIEYAK